MKTSSFKLRGLYLVAANILIPISLFIFASGFFPHKPYLTGLAQHDFSRYGPPLDAPFNKIILMVVDALRSSGFSFTQSLIASGVAIPFTAHARSPTVTMPRIKAISTGSVPSFLDVILNLVESESSSSIQSQDSWLAQMKAKGSGKMLMFGDDTWLKLFPDTFDRSDGTSSFLVSDFWEVDTNVSRHVPQELERQDWNTMVLHYLGLDHIGHKSGPRSPHMILKQIEMDGIVNQIYKAFLTKKHLKSTILVLLGDHGMNEAGNHGGSSPGETSPALVFISPKLKGVSHELDVPSPYREDFKYYSFIEQSDIAPTLSALLGFPIPKNNLGMTIPQFMFLWPGNAKIQIYLQNIEQILRLVKAMYPSFESDNYPENCDNVADSIHALACQWKVIMETVPRTQDEERHVQIWQKAAATWLKQAQGIMSNVASNYDVSMLGIGVVVAILALGFSLAAASHTILTDIQTCLPFLTITFIHGAMMFSSSYIEEEQQFWYWATSAWLGLLWIKCSRNRGLEVFATWLAVLLTVRIARRWNQTGQKFMGESDIVKSYLFKHSTILWALVFLAYAWNYRQIQVPRHPRVSPAVFSSITCATSILALSFKIAGTNDDSPEIISDYIKLIARPEFGISTVSMARYLYLILGVILSFQIVYFYKNKETQFRLELAIQNILMLILYTQSRAENIPLLLIFQILSTLLNSHDLKVTDITTTCLLLQHMSFFSLGGSNAISSIDLSNAYNGIDSFSFIGVGILAFISNWTGPILWTSVTSLTLLQARRKGQKRAFFSHITFLTIFLSSSLVSMMAACTALRSHLFIWTVFSPRFLYSFAWSLGNHLCINLGLGYILFWVGTNT